MFDADNDGYNDIYVCNGIYHDVIDQDFIDFFANELRQKMEVTGVKESIGKIMEQMPSRPQVNNFFHNTKTLKFEEKSADFGFETPSFSNGAAYADLDNDGDLDLVVNNVNMPCFVYRNKTEQQETKNHYLKVKLQGEKQNTFAVGAKVDVYTNNMVLTRSVIPSRGFQSSTEYPLTFGLGALSKVDSIRITWADLRTTVVKNPSTDKLLTYSIKDAKVLPFLQNKAVKSFFELVTNPMDAHQEDKYEDFYDEKNLPALLSKEGPKAAIGDVNGDGKEDVYICGAKNQAGQLYIQTGNTFKKSPQKSFSDVAFFEDTAASFFDADKDGDLDLVVGSGGNETEAGTGELINRLYLNDGKGNFTFASGAIPNNETNTAVIAPYDYDSDGDLDLFVGSRSMPKQYGMNPPSFIYENGGKGVFKDVTKAVCPELESLGMIRDARWEDVNGDKRKELIVVGDWMTPMIFTLKGKKLEVMTTGLENYAGFWGALAVSDIDNDGDNDLILGNMGENFTLHISEEKPLKIWVKDFDENGTTDKILTKTIDGKDVTVFLKREMAEQFPLLKKQILKHSDYAQKSLKDLFPANVLEKALVKTANYCKSAVAINDGKGNFTLVALPETVQLSCVNAITCIDINHDGLNDIVLGGNYTGFIPQLGMVDASRGNILINKGKGTFKVLKNQESGFVTNGEIKQISPLLIEKKLNLLTLINNEVPKLYRLIN